jgi:prefoldin subunit 5
MEEKAGYRVIEYKKAWLIVPIISPKALEEIEKALNISGPYHSVKKHLLKAIEHYRNRPKPDYENSIKESASALESLLKIIMGVKTSSRISLNQILSTFNIFQPLNTAIANLVDLLRSIGKRSEDVRKAIEALEKVQDDFAEENENIKRTIAKLYSCRSNLPGVAHGEGVETYKGLGEAEARFMLVITSALVNYLISKQFDRSVDNQKE